VSDQDVDINTESFLISINDIKDRYFDGVELSADELTAMQNFDKYRLEHLNGSQNEEDFDKRYFQLQVMANLHPYTEFLDVELPPEG
jgi:hypothetical protein